MREEMIFEGDKPVRIRQTFDLYRDMRDSLARAHAIAQSMFGANYHDHMDPICEDIRKIMTKSGLDAIMVGRLIVDEMDRIGEPTAAEKAITMAAIYEVDQEKCPNRN